MSEFEKDLANVMGSFIQTELDCVEKQNQEIEYLKQENQTLKEMFEDSKTYSKQFLYKHNKNLLEANERLSRKNEQLKEENEELREEKTTKIILLGKCRLERDKYKEVIEELNELLSDEFIEVLDKETIIQILDKVKGE